MALDTIAASEEGAKKRRAEFVILRFLNETGPQELGQLEEEVKDFHEMLLREEIDSPFYFRGGGSNGPVSHEFDSSIDRLLQYGRIGIVDDKQYRITERGEEYLANDQKLERHNIQDGLKDAVEEYMN